MKVVQINTLYGEKGSTSRTSLEMHEWLLAHGIESEIYCTLINQAEDLSHVYVFSGKRDRKMHALASRFTGLQGYFSRCSTGKMIKKLEQDQPDVVILRVLHSNCINFPVLFRYLKEKRILTVLVLHDCWYFTGHCTYYSSVGCEKWKSGCRGCPLIRQDNPSWLFDTAAKCLRDKKAWYSSLKDQLIVIGVSDWITEEAKQSILGDARRIQRIYNWIDEEAFYPRPGKEIREKYGYAEDEVLLVAVASEWTEKKGWSTILHAAESLPQYRFLMIGNYSGSREELAPNITMIGSISEKNILAEYYSMADAFLNPSIQETFGKTTAEAICCGVPVIAYGSTATTELVMGSGGILVDTGDRAKFAEAVSDLIRNKDHGERSRKCLDFAAEAFQKEKNLEMYLRLFREELA